MYMQGPTPYTLPASPKAPYVTTSSSAGPGGQSGLQERIYVNLCFRLVVQTGFLISRGCGFA